MRLMHYVAVKWRGMVSNTFDAWMDFVRMRKTFRRNMIESLKRGWKWVRGNAFIRWKDVVKDEDHTMLFDKYNK